MRWGTPRQYAELYANAFTEEWRKELLAFLPPALAAQVRKELSAMKVKPVLEIRPGCQPLGNRNED